MASLFAHVWLEQALSDMRVATLLLQIAEADAAKDAGAGVEGHSDLYCQIASKCQQVVEKGIKAICLEFMGSTVSSHSVDRYIKTICLAPARRNDVVYYVQNALKSNRADIRNIIALVPRSPEGDKTPKNTEYPYHNASGSLVAPASRNAFLLNEIKIHYRLAGVILGRAKTSIALAKFNPTV